MYARFLHGMVGHPDGEHDPNIERFNLELSLCSVRSKTAWPVDCHNQMLFSIRVDEELGMDLVETIAEHNSHHQWRDRVCDDLTVVIRFFPESLSFPQFHP